MSDQVKQLIEHLVATAKARGISQAELAERAGLTPVGLSKAKHRGDIRASSLAAMAAELDMELTVTPRRRREQVVRAIRKGDFFHTGAGRATKQG